MNAPAPQIDPPEPARPIEPVVAPEAPPPPRPKLYRAVLLMGLGVVLLVRAIVKSDLGGTVVGELLSGVVGWGVFVQALAAFSPAPPTASALPGMPLSPGAGWLPWAEALVAWTVGWALFVWNSPRRAAAERAPSGAVGAALHPHLLHYRDFYWRTLGAYGGGVLLAELALILLQSMLAGSGGNGGMAPVVAFSISLAAAFAIAFGGGFLGAARARRLSIPEATVALIYFGLPIPILLTVMHQSPALSAQLGSKLREVVYLSSLLGRPELGYWLVFAGLVLMLFLGITSGFVATSSGRVDLRTGFELFVAERHVSVFRPRLLLSVFGVLMFGIIPPLIVFAILRAANAAAERTRIRALGLKDPLLASEALNAVRLRQQSPTAMMTALSVGGVGVGVMALIIVLSVMSGFEEDLQRKILGTNSHGVVLKYSDSIPEYPEVMEKIREVKGVVGLTPFIHNEVMISSEGNISGALIKGIDPATVGSVTDLPKFMQGNGSLDLLEHPEKIVPMRLEGLTPEGAAFDERPADGAGERKKPAPLHEDPLIDLDSGKGSQDKVVLPGIVLGRELAAQLKVVTGDRVNVVSPLGGELGPQGPMPKSRPFRVAGIFYSGMFEYDSKMVYIHLSQAQSFFNVKGASGIELKMADIDDARRIMRAVYDKLEGFPYRTKDWGEMNRNLFSALRLEKLVMGIILSIIVIVAAGLIVATVIMLVLEKRKEISVLKALGVPDGGIVKIFLAEGLQIGTAGGFLGLFAGLGWCWFIEKVGIKLDPEVYYIPSLPVKIEPVQTAISVLIAILVTFLASIYPALKASQVEPVEGLKGE